MELYCLQVKDSCMFYPCCSVLENRSEFSAEYYNICFRERTYFRLRESFRNEATLLPGWVLEEHYRFLTSIQDIKDYDWD